MQDDVGNPFEAMRREKRPALLPDDVLTVRDDYPGDAVRRTLDKPTFDMQMYVGDVHRSGRFVERRALDAQIARANDMTEEWNRGYVAALRWISGEREAAFPDA